MGTRTEQEFPFEEAVDNPNNQDWARVMVDFTSPEGKKIIFHYAKKVYYEYSDEDTLVVAVERESIRKIRDHPGISKVERDSVWQEQGYLEREVSTEELKNGSYWRKRLMLRHRSLKIEENKEYIPYGISMIEADQLEVGPHKKTVCIVDTGLLTSHPDIDETRASGKDRLSHVSDDLLEWNHDTRGHGTHVAGTIAAKINNDLGVRGVGEIHVYITRGLNNKGKAYESDIRDALEQCEASGAEIINLSLGGSSMSTSMARIINRLYESGRFIVAAAGNAGQYRNDYPAADPKVVSVSAVDSSGWYWKGANFGPTIEMMGPGVSILSTSVNVSGHAYYAEYTGTSMATPHVSGAAALVWSHFPECTNQQIRYALAYTAKDRGDPGCDTDFGYGIVKAKKAYEFLKDHPCKDANWGQRHGAGNCSTLDEEPLSRGPSTLSEPTATPSTQPTYLDATPYPSVAPSEEEETKFSRITSPPTSNTTVNNLDMDKKKPAKISMMPTGRPTPKPTATPTPIPSAGPTAGPTHHPTRAPTPSPTKKPTQGPTAAPSAAATSTKSPTTPRETKDQPVLVPRTKAPTTSSPVQPTRPPIRTLAPVNPTARPTVHPTAYPTKRPTPAPTASPTIKKYRTLSPVATPTAEPTARQPVRTLAPVETGDKESNQNQNQNKNKSKNKSKNKKIKESNKESASKQTRKGNDDEVARPLEHYAPADHKKESSNKSKKVDNPHKRLSALDVLFGSPLRRTASKPVMDSVATDNTVKLNTKETVYTSFASLFDEDATPHMPAIVQPNDQTATISEGQRYNNAYLQKPQSQSTSRQWFATPNKRRQYSKRRNWFLARSADVEEENSIEVDESAPPRTAKNGTKVPVDERS